MVKGHSQIAIIIKGLLGNVEISPNNQIWKWIVIGWKWIVIGSLQSQDCLFSSRDFSLTQYIHNLRLHTLHWYLALHFTG